MSDTEIWNISIIWGEKGKSEERKVTMVGFILDLTKWKFLTINLKKIFNDPSLEHIKWTDPGDRFVNPGNIFRVKIRSKS